MKKKILIALLGGGFSVAAYSQIGINTEVIANNILLHIDGSSNNAAGGAAANRDDVVISNVGNVGVGTVSPTVKLHVVTGGTAAAPVPGLRLNDGRQGNGEGQVLLSNNLGVGSWSEFIPGFQFGVAGGVAGNNITTVPARTALRIELDPGMWMIFYTLATNVESTANGEFGVRFWIKTTLSSNSANSNNSALMTNDAITPNISGSNVFVGYRGVINGWTVINNRRTVAETYNVSIYSFHGKPTNARLVNTASSTDRFSTIYAYRVQMD